MSLSERRHRNLLRAYPEVEAGGFSSREGWFDFYGRISALIRPDMTVLDYGAGRGSTLATGRTDYCTLLGKFQGRVVKVIGVDIDPAVLQNPFVDERYVVGVGEPLPLADESIDLIFSDFVLEHVDTPEIFEAEIRRVLKPGGWFCARTPNRWGTTGILVNLVPNRLHAAILRRFTPEREERDVFRTVYKLNTLQRLKRYFPNSVWKHCTYLHSPVPDYVLRSRALMTIFNMYSSGPRFTGTNLHIFLQKRTPV
jgi:SAM-dependent methyltransferase